MTKYITILSYITIINYLLANVYFLILNIIIFLESDYMDENLELLEHIYKDCDMSCITLEKLLTELKEKDNKIKKKVEEILKDYEKFLKTSKKHLKDYNAPLEENSMMAKMGAKMGIKKEVKCDNSDAAIADMLIKGITMGTIDMEKKINNYQEIVNKKYLEFAKEFLAFQQETIDQLKIYL